MLINNEHKGDLIIAEAYTIVVAEVNEVMVYGNPDGQIISSHWERVKLFK